MFNTGFVSPAGSEDIVPLTRSYIMVTISVTQIVQVSYVSSFRHFRANLPLYVVDSDRPVFSCGWLLIACACTLFPVMCLNGPLYRAIRCYAVSIRAIVRSKGRTGYNFPVCESERMWRQRQKVTTCHTLMKGPEG
jgi:hypothetical protein